MNQKITADENTTVKMLDLSKEELENLRMKSNEAVYEIALSQQQLLREKETYNDKMRKLHEFHDSILERQNEIEKKKRILKEMDKAVNQKEEAIGNLDKSITTIKRLEKQLYRAWKGDMVDQMLAQYINQVGL